MPATRILKKKKVSHVLSTTATKASTDNPAVKATAPGPGRPAPARGVVTVGVSRRPAGAPQPAQPGLLRLGLPPGPAQHRPPPAGAQPRGASSSAGNSPQAGPPGANASEGFPITPQAMPAPCGAPRHGADGGWERAERPELSLRRPLPARREHYTMVEEAAGSREEAGGGRRGRPGRATHGSCSSTRGAGVTSACEPPASSGQAP